MRNLITLFVLFASFSAATAKGIGKDDVLVSVSIVAFLTVILGLVYLADFINKIRKDRDYRNHLRSRVINLISIVRAIFVNKKKEADRDEGIDLATAITIQ